MQKPLKQFTKCSSLTTFFIVFVITFSLSSTALTTFGIGKPQSNPPLATTAPKGRECSSNADCLGIAETSCVKDFDYQLRCLCGDYLAPQNGLCKTRVKGLHHQCRLSEDCEDNMICREQNNTKTTILGAFSKNTNKDKLCFCDEENGYMENIIDKHCNGAVKNFIASIFGYVVAVVAYFAITQKFLQY